MTEPAPHALLRPGIAIPFVLTALIWGSTWYVITGQIAGVSAHWAIAFRFAMATPAMFLLAAIMHRRLAMPRAAHLLALAMGLGGWLRQETTRVERTMAVAGGLLLFYATTLTDVAGAVLFVTAIAWHVLRTPPQEAEGQSA